MTSTVVITERFPTWAAASAAKNRLALNGGFQRLGIEDANVERDRDDFALVIHADHSHAEEIDHLLRSSGTLFNHPLGDRPEAEPGLRHSFLIFGVAAAAGAILYTLFRRRSRRQDTTYEETDLSADIQRWGAGRDDETDGERRQLELDQRAGLRSHDEGYAV
jgi:hypothetical protein